MDLFNPGNKSHALSFTDKLMRVVLKSDLGVSLAPDAELEYL